MTAETTDDIRTAAPVFEYVTVDFTDGATQALQIVDRVIAALEREGQYHAANAFLTTSESCTTDDEVLRLADSLVTVIM